MVDKHSVGRRDLLKVSGAGALGTLAGCIGDLTGGGNGGGDGSEWQDAAAELNLGENWQERRIGAADNWPIEERQDVPDRSNDSTWTESGVFTSALENDLWVPPEGWDDTPAGDVETFTILNHGAANMEFDPATLAAHEYFAEQLGIEVDVIEIGVDQANTREQQFLSSEEGSPHAFNVDGILVPQFVEQGYLEVTDELYPEGGFEPYIPALQSLVEWDLDETREGTHTYGYPNITEASMGHLRPDAVEEQGIDPARFQEEGWSWDLLEETMEAFEGTDMFGFAYYAGTSTYLAYSFRELLFQQGGRMVQDDGTVKMNTDAAITVIEKMKEWRDNNWVPSDVISYGEGDIVDLYSSGQLAYTTAFSDFVPRLLEEFEAESAYRVVVPPAANTGPDPQPAGLVAPNTTSINRFADTGHKLVAMLYGDLKLSYYTQWLEFTYEGNMSFMDQVYEDAGEADFVTFGEVLGQSIENGVLELFPQMSAVFQQMLSPVQRALQGNISPSDAMNQVQDYVDDEVNE